MELIEALKREIGREPAESVSKRQRKLVATAVPKVSSVGPGAAMRNTPTSGGFVANANTQESPVEEKEETQKATDLVTRRREVMDRLNDVPTVNKEDVKAYEDYRKRAWKEYYENVDAWRGYFDQAAS